MHRATDAYVQLSLLLQRGSITSSTIGSTETRTLRSCVGSRPPFGGAGSYITLHSWTLGSLRSLCGGGLGEAVADRSLESSPLRAIGLRLLSIPLDL